MATNTGSNGGKNNPGSGYMKSGAGAVDESSGIASALNQAAYRREFNEKMFSDNGYLRSSINDLEAQQKALKKILETSEKLTASEKTRFKNSMEAMDKIAREQKEIFSKQEASAKEIQDSLNKSAKARLKAIDDIYSHWHTKMNDQDKNMQGVIDRRLQALANQSREIKADIEDINESTDNFNKAHKTFGQGLSESVKTITDAASDIVKTISLFSIAEDQFSKKTQEQYDAINSINRTLGFNLTEGKNAYSSLYGEFVKFNDNIGNLFGDTDIREYFQNAANLGLTNKEAIEENLNQSIIANKYMGLNYDTQQSMYKYMKLTNNNDSIANYNKMMISLTKANMGVSQDMLEQLIKNGQDVNEVLVASGVNMTEYNKGKSMMAASLQSKGIDAKTAETMVESVDRAIQDLYNGNYESLAKRGMGAFQLNSLIAGLNNGTATFEDLYNYTNQNTSRMSAAGRGQSGNVLVSGAWNNALGISAQDSNYAQLGVNTDISENLETLKKKYEETSKDEVENYVKENTAISDLKRANNAIETHLNQFFGNGKDTWYSYASLARVAMGITIAGQATTAIKGIIDVAKAFKTGGFLSKLFSSHLGKGSLLADGSEQMSLFASGGGKAGAALSGIAAVGGGILLGAGATFAISKAIEAAQNKRLASNTAAAKEELKGTALEGNSSAQSLVGLGNTFGSDGTDSGNGFQQFMSGWGSAWNRVTGSVGHGMHKLFGSVSDLNQDNWGRFKADINMRPMTKDDVEAYALTWAMLLMSARRQSDVSELSHFTPEELGAVLSSKGWSKNYIDRVAGDVTIYPYRTRSDKQKVVDWNYLNIDGYHKAGLAYVPKENYRALLHQGEMVLNKEDAEAYRNAFGYGGSLNPKDKDYVGPHHGGYAGHQGIDLYFNKVGTPVGSAVAGTVVESKDIPVDWNDGKKYHGADSNGTHYSSYGRVVKVKSKENGRTYIYAHLNKRAVNTGDIVSAGTLLGWSGSTGNSSGPHLHFQVGSAYGEAAHAKYYTNYVRSANGAAAQTGVSGTIKEDNSIAGNSSMSGERSGLAKVNTTGHRAIPGIGGAGNTPGNTTDRIVNSIDGVSVKIIKYLDEIRKEQEDQRQLINAFSASQQSIIDYR